eukprot:18085-Eustigmatos_ZCMA.PRE.1
MQLPSTRRSGTYREDEVLAEEDGLPGAVEESGDAERVILPQDERVDERGPEPHRPRRDRHQHVARDVHQL